MDENDKTNIVENPATVPNYVHQSELLWEIPDGVH